jgi:transposase
MQAYSLDLRTRVVEAVDRQVGTQQEVATLFGVSGTFIKKLLRQRRETGSLAPQPQGGGQGAKLAEEPRERGRAYMLRTQHDATVSEVHAYVVTTLQLPVSRATVGRVLQDLDLPRKKNARGQRAGGSQARDLSRPGGPAGARAVNCCGRDQHAHRHDAALRSRAPG